MYIRVCVLCVYIVCMHRVCIVCMYCMSVSCVYRVTDLQLDDVPELGSRLLSDSLDGTVGERRAADCRVTIGGRPRPRRCRRRLSGTLSRAGRLGLQLAHLHPAQLKGDQNTVSSSGVQAAGCTLPVDTTRLVQRHERQYTHTDNTNVCQSFTYTVGGTLRPRLSQTENIQSKRQRCKYHRT